LKRKKFIRKRKLKRQIPELKIIKDLKLEQNRQIPDFKVETENVYKKNKN